MRARYGISRHSHSIQANGCSDYYAIRSKAILTLTHSSRGVLRIADLENSQHTRLFWTSDDLVTRLTLHMVTLYLTRKTCGPPGGKPLKDLVFIRFRSVTFPLLHHALSILSSCLLEFILHCTQPSRSFNTGRRHSH